MKILKIVTGAALLGGLLAGPLAVTAAEQDHAGDAKSAKPYTLKTCIVSDEKFGGDMDKPYVFVYQGQEIKLCCKDCKKKFDKEPAKYIKKLAEAQKAAKDAKPAAPEHDHIAHQH
jgi:YHS domain-containing protein